ncbi:hypothetical protein NKR23_g7681 [Pleurostoma richardsiae]|uniref:Transcription factor TFIIIC triple barrel domain-containing protein n=1 Tax=Pleurostoma richardsiae TaxID=41990 RepID=A0AA38RH80_9PEZI|nr:hypothetical protein NKR23_g7681 [Pleurostoma richardsiae]
MGNAPERLAIMSDAAAALPLRAHVPNSCPASDDYDESQWEYEYSGTETENYYLAVDLSHPDFIQRREDWYIPNTRGGYRTWFNPMLAQKATQDTNASLFEEDEEDRRNEDEGVSERVEDDRVPERDEYDSTQAGPGAMAGSATQCTQKPLARSEEVSRGEEGIQILDLHSDNPLISYRGRIFSCTWASNIGTELLFASANEALPALRHVSSDIDLLAASSARLLTSQAALKKSASQLRGLATSQHRRSDRLRSVRKDHGIFIPVVEDKTGKRRPQARFLENFMAIKKLKGEKDEVTTKTKDTPYDDVDDDPDEIIQRRKRAKAQERQRRRTDEIREANRRAGRGRGRGRGRGWVGGAGLVRTYSNLDAGVDGGVGHPRLSTPTPNRWKDVVSSRQDNNDDGEASDEMDPGGVRAL